jgi:hypothetical protein
MVRADNMISLQQSILSFVTHVGVGQHAPRGVEILELSNGETYTTQIKRFSGLAHGLEERSSS